MINLLVFYDCNIMCILILSYKIALLQNLLGNFRITIFQNEGKNGKTQKERKKNIALPLPLLKRYNDDDDDVEDSFFRSKNKSNCFLIASPVYCAFLSFSGKKEAQVVQSQRESVTKGTLVLKEGEVKARTSLKKGHDMMRRLRSSSSNSAVAGGGASTSATTSTKRKRKDKRETLGADVVKQMEQQQQKKPELLDELWLKILKDVDDNSVTAFASVNKQLRRVQQGAGQRLKTDLRIFRKVGVNPQVEKDKECSAHEFSEDWCLWSMRILTSSREEERRKQIINTAAFCGHLNALKQWNDEKGLLTNDTCDFAALGGHLKVLMWLRDNHCPWNWRTCAAAARGGHLEVLKYLHEHRCPWSGSTCYLAARGGHLKVLKYAHEKGCPWDEETCSGAALGGHLEVLQYAYEKGCPWDEATCMYAALI